MQYKNNIKDNIVEIKNNKILYYYINLSLIIITKGIIAKISGLFEHWKRELVIVLMLKSILFFSGTLK